MNILSEKWFPASMPTNTMNNKTTQKQQVEQRPLEERQELKKYYNEKQTIKIRKQIGKAVLTLLSTTGKLQSINIPRYLEEKVFTGTNHIGVSIF